MERTSAEREQTSPIEIVLSSRLPQSIPVAPGPQTPTSALRVLLVVAHPDDEYYCAGAIYRLTREMGAVVDQVTVTNGESGFRFSHLAEQFYGVCLTNPDSARSSLPEIRRREALAASRILGVRVHRFLNQIDDRCDNDDLHLGQGWDHQHIRSGLRDLIQRERYSVVLTVLPTASTHPHHRLVTELVVDLCRNLDTDAPLVLGVEAMDAVHPLEYRLKTPTGASMDERRLAPDIFFDRRLAVGGSHHARYEVIVNWVIAEHKSQGLFQTEVGRHRYECFWLLNREVQSAHQRLQTLSEQIVGSLPWQETRTA